MLIDHLEKLHYFSQVIKAGTFNKAAQNLYLTQPTLSKSIRLLEESLDKRLLIRTHRGVIPTKEGKILFDYCEKMLKEIESIEKSITQKEQEISGTLNIGTYESIAVYFWPNFIKEFKSVYPKLNIKLFSNHSDIIQAQLEAGAYDVALTVSPQKKKMIHVENLFKDRFSFYIKKSTKSLKDLPLIYMSSVLEQYDLNLKKQLLTYHENNYVTDSLETVKALTIEGLGIGLLPEHVAKSPLKQKLIKKVDINEFDSLQSVYHDIGISFSSYRQGDENVQVLLKELREYIKKSN